jgi:putative nucleotidyltransferase with HDIG domain
MLSNRNFECVEAATAEEAMVALQRTQFDLIISDIHMPGMGGLALIPEARRQQPHAALLVTTGEDSVEVGVRAMRGGADDYLLKPLIEDAVIISVQRALHKRQLERELENYRQHLEDMVAERTSQLRSAMRELQESYTSTLQALGAAIDLRDKDTAGHSRRVCAYALEIARSMNVPEAQLENLARGAYLHDIGKLGIPDSILLKPGSLTSDERKTMQQHVRIGFNLVKGIPFLEGAAEIVLTHHERFDGGGYPAGSSGREIPVAGRIFAVVDAFDAITSDRPYRAASPLQAAREIIRQEAGRQFDPYVVAAFLNVSTERWKEIASGKDQPADGNSTRAADARALPANLLRPK